MYIIEQQKYNDDLKIEIWIDEYQDDFNNPRSWENLGTMVCWHGRYEFGDEQPTESPQDWLDSIADEIAVKIPLYLIDHSGLSMNTSGYQYADPQGWDSGQVGWIYATYEDLTENLIDSDLGGKAHALVILEKEVEMYDHYLQGNIYGYSILRGDNLVDSCGGFVGEMEYCVSEALEMAKHYADADLREDEEIRYWNSRDVTTV